MRASHRKTINETEFREGVTEFSLHSFRMDSFEVRIVKGKVYIMDHDSAELIEFKDPSYIGFIHLKDIFIFSTFVKIEIYQGLNFLVQYNMDDIDGIRLQTIVSETAHGEFRQISQSDFNNWLPFKIDLNSLELECDRGRMWSETRMVSGIEKECYKTMDLKK